MFTHGNGLCVQSYQPMLGRLEAQADIHALNLRGHGGSSVPESIEGWGVYEADMLAYLRANLKTPVMLAGHSMGAILSLKLACDHPDLVKGLLLLEPPLLAGWQEAWPGWDNPGQKAFLEQTENRRAHWPDRSEAMAYLSERGIYRNWHPGALERFGACGLKDTAGGGVELACPPWLEVANFQGHPGARVFDWAGRVRTPSVLMYGEHTHLSAKGVNDLAGLLPVAVLYVAEGGHVFPMEHPEQAGTLCAQGLEILLGYPGPFPDSD